MTKEDQFEIFWKSYPRRIGKGAARTAFLKAIGKTTLEAMLQAIPEYVANKPGYQDFKHPSTWLNQECWCDEWTLPTSRSDNMADFMRQRQENRNARTIDAEHAGRSDRRAIAYSLEDTPASRRH